MNYFLWATIFFFMGIFIYYVKNLIYFLLPEKGRVAFAILYLIAGGLCYYHSHSLACLLWFGASGWCMAGLYLHRKKKKLQEDLLEELDRIANEQDDFFDRMKEQN